MLMQPSLSYMDAIQNDPLRQYVALLLYGEGADGSQTFVDHSPYARTVTAFGAVENDTGVAVAGTPSMLFGSDSNYLTGAYGSELDITVSSPDFCFEAYVYCTNVTANQNQIWGRRRNSGQYVWGITSASKLFFASFNGSSGLTRLTCSTTLANNTVYHLCIIRIGTAYYGFVNGVPDGNNDPGSGTAISSNTTALYIGQSENDQPARYWYGSMNWLRMTMGHSRYPTGGFTPPPVPLSLF